VKLAQLSPTELVERLTGPGLRLQTGPFIFHLEVNLLDVIQGLRDLYADFSVFEVEDFSDFYIKVTRPRSWRRWVWPQVIIDVDGETPSDPLPVNQAFAAFEGCLNWCIYTFAHQYFIIHAAAVERHGCAAILPAPQGSGKSTLCAALVNSGGWRLLTDELVLMESPSGAIVPLARPISLKNESIGIIRGFAPHAVFGPVSPDTIKGTIAHLRPPAESVARVKEYCRPAWVVFPRYQSGMPAVGRRVPKGQGFMRVAASSVNYALLGEAGFKLLSEIVDRADCYDFEYSDLREALAWFDDLAESNRRLEAR
jgi:HprK-related kinase A